MRCGCQHAKNAAVLKDAAASIRRMRLCLKMRLPPYGECRCAVEHSGSTYEGWRVCRDQLSEAEIQNTE